MRAKVSGALFRTALSSLVGANVLFPDLKRRVSEMKDDRTYDWDEYVAMMNAIAAKVTPPVVSFMGAAVVKGAGRSALGARVTCEAALEQCEGFFTRAFGLASASRIARTVDFRPGEAIIEADATQPASLVEGYLRGIVELCGRFVTELRSERVEGKLGPVHRVTVRWE